MRRLLVMVILGLAVAGCAGTTAAHSPSKAPSAAVLQFRVVLRTSDATSQAPDSGAPAASLRRFSHFTCPRGNLPVSNPHSYLIACDAGKNRYLLAPAAWQGTVKDAQAGSYAGSWAVDFSLGAVGTRALAAESRELYNSGGRLAVVLDGRVLVAPGFEGVITDGTVQISGNFNETAAKALAHRLTGR